MTTPARRALAGFLILSMIVITIAQGYGLLPVEIHPLWIAGFGAWLAALLLFADASRVLKIQVSILLAAGIGLIVYARQRDALIDPDIVISSSTGLMTMIASVGFLRLVVLPDETQTDKLPHGPKAYWQTLFGLSLSSSVINISAPILISDRIHQQRPLQRFTAQSFVRVFCGVSSWSPFFGAMAVVLTYVSDARLFWVIVAGFPFMLIGFIGVLLEAKLRYKNELEAFVGYPTHLNALLVPAILMITVLLLSRLLPETPILVLIASGALLVTAMMLMIRRGPTGALRGLGSHVVRGLPTIVNELCLFLAAGVLAAGITALITQNVIDNPFDHFDVITAIEVLAIILFSGFIGIHPIVMISSFSPMLLSLEPDPNLLAATFLFGWHLGTCASPLSGTNLVFQGRYAIDSWRLARWNWPYALAMLGAAALWLPLVDRMLP